MPWKNVLDKAIRAGILPCVVGNEVHGNREGDLVTNHEKPDVKIA